MQYQNYERIIHAGVEESLSKIVDKIRSNSIVLDVGCGTGMLGKFLSPKKNCIVDGVDFNKDAIALCSSVYRNTAVKNLECDSLVDVFDKQTYDYIVVADVVEHLVNPDKLLLELGKLVKPDGLIIFSVPNITHLAAGLELVLGQFKYSNNGLLDNTHLRFYSKRSLLDKLEECGLFACHIDNVKKEIIDTEFGDEALNFFPNSWIDSVVSKREDALTYQWIVSTKTHKEHNRDALLSLPVITNPSLFFTSELYWTDESTENFTAEKKIIGHLLNKSADQITIEFPFSDIEVINNLQKIRIDPISDEKPFFIVDAAILTEEKKTAWVWQPEVIGSEMQGARLVEYFDSDGCLFESKSNDPQWYPSVKKEILNRVEAGWVFRLSLKLGDSLTQFCSEKLIGLIKEPKDKIDNLLDQEKKLQELIVKLNGEIESYRSSRSWKLTRPLRALFRSMDKLKRLRRLYLKYRKNSSNVDAFYDLTSSGFLLIKRYGVREFINRIKRYEGRNQEGVKPSYVATHRALLLKDLKIQDSEMPSSIAVHFHVFYENLVPEMRLYIENIPVPIHLFITTDTVEKVNVIELLFSNMNGLKSLEIAVVENRGRDIFPMIVHFGASLAKHDLVLHIHTKRSVHNSAKLAGWRRYLLESLVGNPQRVNAIFQQFYEDESLGILFPNYYQPIKPLVYLPDGMLNDKNIKKLLIRAGKNKSEINRIDRTFFPAGDMFWFRGKAIEPFVNMSLDASDFELEVGQINATMAHAIERMFPYFAKQVGLTSKMYLPAAFLSEDSSAHNIELFSSYLQRGLIGEPSIIFDHNGGGGTNVYTKELVRNITFKGGTILRVYHQDRYWFLQWIANDDEMLFFTASLSELFKCLELSRARSVILNSLYGYPAIKLIAERIISLVQNLKISLDFKVHDFYAMCPSPHLSNFEGKYCSVPENPEVCRNCLKKNRGWYHEWYPKENMTNNISEWRAPFVELLKVATAVTVFDQSTIEILNKGFDLDYNKIKLVPHSITYFDLVAPIEVTGSLHVGILGTLSHTKGGEVVKDLSEFIREKKSNIPITVVGSSFVELPEMVHVYGDYEQNKLRSIICDNGINVILMASIVPETFSFTISEAMKMELPIVAFDIGAQGRRVKEYKLGKVVPLGSSSGEILSAMQSVLKIAKELKSKC